MPGWHGRMTRPLGSGVAGVAWEDDDARHRSTGAAAQRAAGDNDEMPHQEPWQKESTWNSLERSMKGGLVSIDTQGEKRVFNYL